MSTSTIWSLLFKLEADNAELRRVIDDTERRLGAMEGTVNRSSRNFSAGFSQMGRGVGQLGSGLDRLATRSAVAAAAGITAVTMAAVTFEDQFAGVRKTVEATDEQLATLRGELRGMAREMPLAHGELAAVAEQAGALGIATPNIAEFTRVAALLGITTDVSADQAATSLGVLSNILGLTDKDYERFGSTLVDLGNKGASTESQILGIAERAGAGAKLINMATSETLGWSAALANIGMEVEAGGSSLQRFFQMSLEHVAKGGDELALYAETAGMASDAFAELFGRDSSAALERFVAGLGELEEAERLAVLEALGFNDIRISRALLGLSGNVDQLSSALNTAEEAWAANSALGAEAEKRFETTASQLQILRNNILDAAITIGDNLLPILNDLVKSGVAWLLEHEGEIDQFGQDLAAGIRSVVDELKGADFTVMVETMKGAASVAKTAFDAFMMLPDPVKQLLLGLFVANKVSGGAVGQIAKGLGNILAGGLKIGLGMRGASPANPMWVQMVGGGLGGGLAGGKGGGILGGLLKWVVGPLAAVAVGAEVAKDLNEPVIGPARDAETAGVANLLASGTLADLRRGRAAILEQLHSDDIGTQVALIASRIPLVGDALGNVAPVLEEQLAAIDARIGELGGVRPGANGGRRGGGSFGPTGGDAAGADAAMLAQFGGKLDKLATNEVIEHLRRTNEMGLEGVGTSFQVGLKNGLDPVGDTATRILARAENPKDPPVMAEIRGHIAGLEEIQATYLERGDIALAAKVQANIDTLHGLIGTVDANNAITELQRQEAAGADAAMLGSLATVKGAVDALHGTLAAKNFAPRISVSVAAEIYANTAGAGITGAKIRGTTPVALHEGTMAVPASGLAMLHEGEMVVPRFEAEAFREFLAGGGSGGSTYEFHEGAIQIHNPVPEPASRSQARALRDIALRQGA